MYDMGRYRSRGWLVTERQAHQGLRILHIAEETGFSSESSSTPHLKPVDNSKAMIGEVLLTLTLREQRIIHLRFGLEDGIGHTLEQIGKEFSVTRERIRQIEDTALTKLRHPSRSRKLRGLFESEYSLGKGYKSLLRAIFGEDR